MCMCIYIYIKRERERDCWCNCSVLLPLYYIIAILCCRSLSERSLPLVFRHPRFSSTFRYYFVYVVFTSLFSFSDIRCSDIIVARVPFDTILYISLLHLCFSVRTLSFSDIIVSRVPFDTILYISFVHLCFRFQASSFLECLSVLSPGQSARGGHPGPCRGWLPMGTPDWELLSLLLLILLLSLIVVVLVLVLLLLLLSLLVVIISCTRSVGFLGFQ